MTRKGRDLEQLVARIKELQFPEATVRSPEFVKDRDTGEAREVDVGVRVIRASDEVFIALECRDRTAIQDVQWVEQLISKKESVGADVLVAVSSSRFAEPARVKALKRGVVLTRMTDRLPEEIEQLANSVFITFHYVAPRVVSVQLGAPVPLDRPIDSYTYRHKSVQRDLSLVELCAVWSRPNLIRTITGRIDDFEKAKFAKVGLEEINATVRTEFGDVEITRAELSYELNYGELPLPLISIKEHKATDFIDHQDAAAFRYGIGATTLSEILLDVRSNTIRWDLMAKPLLAEGKVVIGGRLRAREPVGIEVMSVEL